MHNIRYTYPNGNNRLGSISSTGISSSAYKYDALGNLVHDNAEDLTVSWNALGKVDTIRRNGNTLSSFRYSPTGQRQVKTDSSGVTFYIHDATGNVMCIYRQNGDTLRATERYLYGSKRLGVLEQQVWITANSTWLQDSNTIGARVYEFTDHLGNVTYTAQDRKHLVQDSYGQWQFIPFAVTYTDYYPFGFPMPGRSFTMGGYRYFFNGQEADNEVFGEGVSLTAEFWQYDSRLGRRWNVDPNNQRSISVYSCFNNNPIWFVDVKGDTVRYKSGRERMDVFFARLFSKAFRKEFNELQKSRKTYTYARMNKKDTYDSGGFISVDDATANHPVSQFTIHYRLLAKDFTGRSIMHAIFEETFHAVDYEPHRSSSMIGFNQDFGLYTIGHNAKDRSHEARAWQFAAVNAPFLRKRPSVRIDGKLYFVYNPLALRIRNLPKRSDIPAIETLLYEVNIYQVRQFNVEDKSQYIKEPEYR